MSTEQIEALESALRDAHAREIEQEHALRALTADLEHARAEADELRREAGDADLQRALMVLIGVFESTQMALVDAEAGLAASGDAETAERYTKLRLVITRAQQTARTKLKKSEG